MKQYKSGKQRRAEIKAARQECRQARHRPISAGTAGAARPASLVPVDHARLTPNNSYGQSDFAVRGYYLDQPFRCCDCGAEGVWTAERQRWWYETLGGSQYTTAKRCAACRAKERQRRAQARQVAEAGQLQKQARLAAAAGR